MGNVAAWCTVRLSPTNRDWAVTLHGTVQALTKFTTSSVGALLKGEYSISCDRTKQPCQSGGCATVAGVHQRRACASLSPACGPVAAGRFRELECRGQAASAEMGTTQPAEHRSLTLGSPAQAALSAQLCPGCRCESVDHWKPEPQSHGQA